MDTLGATLELVEPGRVVLAMAHRQAALTQQHGFIHAGMVSCALDSACGYAAFSLMPDDAAVLTIEFKINLIAPARGCASASGPGHQAGPHDQRGRRPRDAATMKTAATRSSSPR